MKKTTVRLFTGNSEEDINGELEAFVRQTNLTVVSVSNSCCYDADKKQVVHGLALVYSYTIR